MTIINVTGKRGVRNTPVQSRDFKQLLRTGPNCRYSRGASSHRAKILTPGSYLKTDALRKEENARRTGRFLQEYTSLFKEIDELLDNVIEGNENEVNERAVSRIPQRNAHEDAVLIHVPKETILAKLRVAMGEFTIELETRKAHTSIGNIDKVCLEKIINRKGTLSGEGGAEITAVAMELMIVILKETRDFLDHIYKAEEFTRIDELLEKYDGLVETLIKFDSGLAKIEERAKKSAVRTLGPECKLVTREEFMGHFRKNMLGSIELNEDGEEIYHTPETSEYLGKRNVVEQAIHETNEMIYSLHVSADYLSEVLSAEEEKRASPENLIRINFGKGTKG